MPKIPTEYQIYNESCFETFKRIPDGSIDMVMCDPPYGTTACKWDSIIPLEPMWKELKRVVKPDAAIVMTCSQPFTSTLISSQIGLFKYEWVWDKSTISNPLQAKYQPLRQHENIAVFGLGVSKYFPIKTEVHIERRWVQSGKQQTTFGKVSHGAEGIVNGKYPKSIQNFKSAKFEGKNQHPTQKPVALMEYLIKTYTNVGDTVLDFAFGSGTTGVAAGNLGRRFIGCDNDTEHGYFQIAQRRISEAYAKNRSSSQ